MRSPRRYDAPTIHAVLTRLVEHDPDRRDGYLADGHTTARYVVNGAPNCVVAVVLAELGCSINVLKALDREARTDRDKTNGGIQLLASRNPWLLRIRPEARALLASVQRHQDIGMTWAEAVAKSVAPTISWLDQRTYGWAYGRETRPWIPLLTIKELAND